MRKLPRARSRNALESSTWSEEGCPRGPRPGRPRCEVQSDQAAAARSLERAPDPTAQERSPRAQRARALSENPWPSAPSGQHRQPGEGARVDRAQLGVHAALALLAINGELYGCSEEQRATRYWHIRAGAPTVHGESNQSTWRLTRARARLGGPAAAQTTAEPPDEVDVRVCVI